MKSFVTAFIFFGFGITFCCNTFAQATQNELPIAWQNIENNTNQNFINPVALYESARVNSQPDTSSPLVTVLKFRTPLKLVRQGEQQLSADATHVSRFVKWYEINLQHGIAYIRASSVATHSFYNALTNCHYFLATDFTLQNNQDSSSFVIYKYDDNTRKFADTLSIKNFRATIVREVNYDGWKNVSMFIHASGTNVYSAERATELFIVDANNKLSELTRTSVFEDGANAIFASSVWLPIKFKTGNVLQLLNGDVENAFDTYAGKLNTHALPPNFNIPKMEAVVFEETKIEKLFDKNGDRIKNTDGNFETKTLMLKTTYFQWNGNKLIPVK